MSSRYLAFSTVCVFVVLLTKVADVNSCEMTIDASLINKEIKIEGDEHDAYTNVKFTKCVGGKSGCRCVPSGYDLVPVTYVARSSGEEVKKNVYNVTGCKCVKKQPLNTVVTGQKFEKSYMHEYKMMSYCTYALSAVCAIFGIIIIVLCLRYEMCCSKNKKSGKIGKNEQHKPLTGQTSREDKV